MKENRLSPNKWAFVVIAGGAVCALPFTQRIHSPVQQQQPSEPDPLDELPEIPTIAQLPVSSALMVSHAGGDVSLEKRPMWAEVPQSPFDELISKPATVPVSQPPVDALPLQPLRPWISGPPTAAKPIAASSLPSPLVQETALAMATPFREEPAAEHPTFVHSSTEPQLPVDAWPDQKYSDQQVAQHVQVPRRELQSAIVTPDQVLPPEQLVSNRSRHSPGGGTSASLPVTASATLRSPAIKRQTGVRPTGAQVRFGQSGMVQPSAAAPAVSPAPAGMVPLPTLPEERKQHVIFQPRH